MRALSHTAGHSLRAFLRDKRAHRRPLPVDPPSRRSWWGAGWRAPIHFRAPALPTVPRQSSRQPSGPFWRHSFAVPVTERPDGALSNFRIGIPERRSQRRRHGRIVELVHRLDHGLPDLDVRVSDMRDENADGCGVLHMAESMSNGMAHFVVLVIHRADQLGRRGTEVVDVPDPFGGGLAYFRV